MDRVEASVVVYLPPGDVYDLLFEYTGYDRHTPHLDAVEIDGKGADTRFQLTFAWWKLSHTARCRVTGVDPPERIDYEVLGGIDARGHWAIEPVPSLAPPDRETATRARMVVEFDRHNSRVAGLRLPPMVSIEWVLERIRPLVLREAEKMARGVVGDVEGRRRPVDLEVHAAPETI